MIVALAVAWGLAAIVLGKRWLAERERKMLAASITRLEIECGLRAAPQLRRITSPRVQAARWADATASAATNYEDALRRVIASEQRMAASLRRTP